MIYVGEKLSARVRLAKWLLKGTDAEAQLEKDRSDAGYWSLFKPWLEDKHPEIKLPTMSELWDWTWCRVLREKGKIAAEALFGKNAPGNPTLRMFRNQTGKDIPEGKAIELPIRYRQDDE